MERLTKPAGRNATYRKERVLEIIDKLKQLEDDLERGELVSKEWHDEQVMQLQTQLENSITLPVKFGKTLYFICSEYDELEEPVYGIATSNSWVYLVTKNNIYIQPSDNHCNLDGNYSYTLNKNVFTTKQAAIKCLQEIQKDMSVS